MTRPHVASRCCVLWSVVPLFVLGAAATGAQCPDGTPPPCRGGVPTALRRVNPVLDQRAWIVVPFTNITKAQELDWLREASVNLLSLDLSRWTDISVVDDKRVADLVRELPSARGAQALSLNDGLALARRVGAGRLVMGDFFKQGKGARIVASVFNVRDGSRIRSITQQAPDQDSLLAAFGPLARGVLAVPPPSDARVGATGTTSVDAYQEYLLGVRALNRFELSDAKQHLLKTLAIDPSFALAHLKLSMAIHWEDTRTDTTERAHAVAAARLGGSLPPRERALISGRVASSVGDYERACVTLATLVAKDSSDVEALYNVGECQYHAVYLVPEPIDSVRGRTRGNWNVAIAAFRRVLVLDPSYHPAFEHVLDMLTTQTLTICASPGVVGCGNDLTTYSAFIVRDADSLLIVPVRGNFAVKDPWRARVTATRTPLRNMETAQRIAQEWVDAGPAEARAHLNLATMDLLLGKLEAADRELRQITATADPYARRMSLRHRVEAAILLGRATEGRKLLDTLWRATPEGKSKTRDLGPLYAAFGQLQPLTKSLESRAVDERWSPERARYWQQAPRAMLGLPTDSLARDERLYWEHAVGDTLCEAGRPRCRATLLWPSMAYAARAPRSWWPFRGTSVAGFRFFVPFFFAGGDTARVRTIARWADSLSARYFMAGNDDQGMSIQAVEAALVLRDSATALRGTRWFVDSLMPAMNRMHTSLDDDWGYLIIPRMMLQRADLAAALGFPDEARFWYTRMRDLWAEADPELQPAVAMIRAALAALGPSRQ